MYLVREEENLIIFQTDMVRTVTSYIADMNTMLETRDAREGLIAYDIYICYIIVDC